MAYAIDSRLHLNSYPTPISTDCPPSGSKPQYNYTYATPASTPTKPYPSYFYHYRPASPPPRSIRRTSASVPNFLAASSSVPTSGPRSKLLSASPNTYTHSRREAPSHSPLPNSNARRSAKQEGDRSSPAQTQQHQQDAQDRRARLCAERDATLKRMEERQREAQGQPWFEEGLQLAADAARVQEEVCRELDEKLRRVAQARAEEGHKLHTRKQEQKREREFERSRSQARHPAAGVGNKEWDRDGNRDSFHKGERGSGRQQHPERERKKNENRARGEQETRERVTKDRARRADSPSSVEAAWAIYTEACTELMQAKPPKDKKSGRVTFFDIPWPIIGQANSFNDLTNENIAAFLLSPHHSKDKTPKTRLRAAILIWHPDARPSYILLHIPY
ncbi:hypothetical protein FRC11_012851 [Ceratobasidium sp. 423]|nr:hypothetical protein FRC11_012851 [Ceratobasidium sp. 423]